MRSFHSWYPFLVCCCLAAAAVSFGSACSKKPVTGQATGGVTDSTLPGAADVINAASAKDYQKAMQLWADLRSKVRDNDQATQFSVLTSELKFKLMEAPPTDTKAQEALGLIRATTIAR